ncbi:MAG: hypothetical protein L0Z49_07655 [Actinobacteria bacterium]|nr:hypothetical protein [Actinomycetota bacterium]
MRRVLVSALLLLLAACNEPSGTLVSLDEQVINGFRDFSAGTDKSFGIFVCASDGPVRLVSVGATSIQGSIEVLGGYVYEAEDGFVGAVDGFPPTGLAPETLQEIDGAVVDTDCGEADPVTRTQIIIGVERGGPGGGVVDSVTVRYSGGELVADYTIVLCGDELEFCEGLEDVGGEPEDPPDE